jgi:hypothetical protein
VATEAAWLIGKKEKNSWKEQKTLLTWIGLLMEGATRSSLTSPKVKHRMRVKWEGENRQAPS